MSPMRLPVSRTRPSASGSPSSCSNSEGVALVNLLQDGSGALEEMRERARSLGIVLDEHLMRDAGRARDELDTLAQVISANLTRAALKAAPVIADLSSWLADVAGKAGIAWERLFDAPEEKSLRTLRYELDLASSTIEKLEGRIQELRESPTLGFTTFIDTAQINALETKLDELRRARDQTQARIAFLEGPPDAGAPAPATAPTADDTAGVQDRAKNLQRIARELEGIGTITFGTGASAGAFATAGGGARPSRRGIASRSSTRTRRMPRSPISRSPFSARGPDHGLGFRHGRPPGLSSITTEQFFNQVPTLNPRETAHVQVSVDFPSSPTDHLLVAVYTTLDDTSEVWDLIPMMEFLIENTTDPNRISFLVTGVYKFRVGVQPIRVDGHHYVRGPELPQGRREASAGSGTPSRASSCRPGKTRSQARHSATVACVTAGAVSMTGA